MVQSKSADHRKVSSSIDLVVFFLNIYYIKYEIYELHDDTKLNYRKEHKSTSTHLYDNKNFHSKTISVSGP